jgi:arylsulfatase A
MNRNPTTGLRPSFHLIRISGLLALASCYLATTAIADPKPNIIILYADDMGYGDLGANNPASKIPTPRLDRLAAEGMRFTDGHSSSGVCTPSRYAMLTGRYHWRDFHGIVNAFDGPAFKPGRLTMPEMLRKQGYTTACIGKWHLGFDWNSIRKPGSPARSPKHDDYDWSKPFRGGPCDHGFDTYFGDNVINFPPYAWIENDRLPAVPDKTFEVSDFTGKPNEGGWECRPGPGRSDWDPYQALPTLTRRGVDFIQSRKGKDQPFFLYFALPSPHAPVIPNEAFISIIPIPRVMPSGAEIGCWWMPNPDTPPGNRPPHGSANTAQSKEPPLEASCSTSSKTSANSKTSPAPTRNL